MQNIKPTYTILSYYYYTPMPDLIPFSQQHHALCIKHNILGRIILAQEGINGTLSGLQKDVQQYMHHLQQEMNWHDIRPKTHPAYQHAFRKLNIRIKREIVHAGLPHIKPYQQTGKHINTLEFEKMRKQNNVVLLDVRSNYEHRLGKFKNAITLNINHFREFPQQVPSLKHLKNKKIITYCTGAVKTEKASAYLLEQGFKHVYQLQGGIIKYSQESDGTAFEGSCYVFDNRLTIPINKKNPNIISTCYICQKPCERLVNCANTLCNRHVPLCHTCATTYQGTCSIPCKKNPAKRAYNGTGYYTKKSNGYNPAHALR